MPKLSRAFLRAAMAAEPHCEAWTERVTRLAYGLLSPAEAVEVKAHLKTCRACRLYFADRLKAKRRTLGMLGKDKSE